MRLGGDQLDDVAPVRLLCFCSKAKTERKSVDAIGIFQGSPGVITKRPSGDSSISYRNAG